MDLQRHPRDQHRSQPTLTLTLTLMRGVPWITPAATWVGNATVTLESTPEGLSQKIQDLNTSPGPPEKAGSEFCPFTDPYDGPHPPASFSAGPLWRPAGSYTDLTFLRSSTQQKTYSHREEEDTGPYTDPYMSWKRTYSYGEEERACRFYDTPRLPGEGEAHKPLGIYMGGYLPLPRLSCRLSCSRSASTSSSSSWIRIRCRIHAVLLYWMGLSNRCCVV